MKLRLNKNWWLIEIVWEDARKYWCLEGFWGSKVVGIRSGYLFRILTKLQANNYIT
jgi:hypothetical protein